MPRSARSIRLETRTSRLKLPAGKRHAVAIGQGLILIYRRGPQSSTWTAKALAADGRYILRAMGQADDRQQANGVDILDFYQAQEQTRQFAHELKAAAGIVTKPLTVGDAATRYLAWYREHRRAFKETEATVKAHILPTFEDKLVTDLTTREIREWHHKLAARAARVRTSMGGKQQYKEKPATEDEKRSRRATANRVLTVLKAILNKAYQDELVPDDSAWSKVKPFEHADEPIIRFLTATEAQRLINACRPDFRQLVQAALYTGARYNELATLKAADVRTDQAAIYLAPSKSGKARHVPLNAEGLRFFKAAVAGKTGDTLALTKQDGTPWGKNHHVRLLKEACGQAKIIPAITFHELRHTYASLLAQAGADLLTISKLLGHADTRITSRHYAHLCDKTLANAVQTYLPSFGHEAEGKVKALRPKSTQP